MALEIELSDFFSKNEIVQKELDPLTTQILYQVKNEDEEVKQIILQVTKQILKLRRDK